MRPWSRLAAPLVLAAALPASAARSYDPELALLVLTVQRESAELLREELVRQADFLGLGGMQVILGEKSESFARSVKAGLGPDTDLLEEYRRAILAVNPGAAGEADRLIDEIRSYHDLAPGAPLTRVPLKSSEGPARVLLEEEGVGADVVSAVKGTPSMEEPVAYAERRFGTTGPFLRKRLWNLDFYLGAFEDLAPRYRALGYRRAYRLRAPYVSYGKQAYVLAPEPGLRPRLVYCAFHGQDLFLHTRAQWAVLTELAQGRGPTVRTLTCASCTWTPPAVTSMRRLLASVPFSAETVISGYPHLFHAALEKNLIGSYENEFWRLTYYKAGPAPAVVVEARHSNFGEILASALSHLVRRGAKRVYFAGPAAQVDEDLDPSDLQTPTEFTLFTGKTVPFKNALARRKTARLFSGLPSPLYATQEWFKGARRRRIAAFDGEMARLAEAAAAWTSPAGEPVECGIGAVLGGLSSLHPEEDRAVYSAETIRQTGRESAKKQFRDAVLDRLRAAARAADEGE